MTYETREDVTSLLIQNLNILYGVYSCTYFFVLSTSTYVLLKKSPTLSQLLVLLANGSPYMHNNYNKKMQVMKKTLATFFTKVNTYEIMGNSYNCDLKLKSTMLFKIL